MFCRFDIKTGSLLLTAETDMDSQKTILTPFNYFEWKAEMEILLRVKGIYRVIMGVEFSLSRWMPHK